MPRTFIQRDTRAGKTCSGKPDDLINLYRSEGIAIMDGRSRLLRALTGQAVDRVPVNFYEIGGHPADPDDPDPFNIFNDPSWRPLLALAETETDIIRMCAPRLRHSSEDCRQEFFSERTVECNGSRYHTVEVRIGGRVLRSQSRHDRDVLTDWQTEHLLKGPEDVYAFLDLPDEVFACEPDITPILDAERALGDRGLVMIDTEDPLCAAASLFSMEDYLALAYTDAPLFHRLLEKCARAIYPRVEKTATTAPGRLWRIVGPEYAGEPYLPPALFKEYVCGYTTPIVRAVQRSSGWARLHAHGCIRNILPLVADMGVDAIDPIEPPPQGDVALEDVRRDYGAHITLFGNIEVSAIETMAPHAFERLVAQTIRAGVSGSGRGFVLMPTAAPYGRRITETTMRNYETLVRLAHNSHFAGL